MRRKTTTMLAVAALFALASCGGSKSTGQKTMPNSTATPTAFFEAYKKASLAGDHEAVWGMLTKDTQTSQLAQVEKLRTIEGANEMLGISADELASLPADKLLHLVMAKQLKDTHDKVAGTVIDRIEDKGADQAIVHTTDATGKTSRGVIVREGGVWKLDLVATAALEEEVTGDIIGKRPVG